MDTLDLASAAPGEKPEFCGVSEQRVTGVLIFLMIGLSVFFTPLLSMIPMPVLYGVFLYMGFRLFGDASVKWSHKRYFIT